MRSWAADRFEVRSAGLEPKAAVDPRAIEVMREVGIDLGSQVPKSVKQYLGKVAIHYAIFVCERAEQQCPNFYPNATQRIYWPFEDPVQFVGSPEETLEKFRAVRDQIGARIQSWLKTIGEESK